MCALLEYWDWLVVDAGVGVPFSKYPKSHPLAGGGEGCWDRNPGSLAGIPGSLEKRNSFLHLCKHIHLLNLCISFCTKDPPFATRMTSIWNLKEHESINVC